MSGTPTTRSGGYREPDRSFCSADFREYFKANYGPTIAAYNQQPDAERAAGLDADLDALSERFDVGENGHLVLDWEYLLVTCRRA